MAHAGRKRKEGVARKPSGKPRDPTAAEMRSVVINQPHRKGNGSAIMGYAHGRLWANRHIDRRQHEAAEHWLRRTVAYMAHIVCRVPNLPSAHADMVARGLTCAADLTPDDIARIRSDFQELQDALADSGRMTSGATLTRVIVMDRDPDPQELGILREGLNVIANRLRIPKMDDAC